MICVIGGASQRRRCASSARHERDREADRHRHQRQVHVVPERADVAVEVVGDPARADAVVRDAAVGAAVVVLERLGEQLDHAAIVWEMSSIESTPTTCPCSVGHRRVLDVRAHHLAERVAQGVVEAEHRLGPVGEVGRREQVDVAHPLQGQDLERPVLADEVLDERVRRVHQQLGGRRVLGEDPALLQDRDPVAHLDRLVDVVGDEDDRLADLGLQAQELVLQPLAVDRVDRPERLVHQHHRRVGGERAGDADALALAARQLRRVAPAQLALEADQVQQLVHARRRPALVPAQQLRDRGDVVGDRAVREQADLLDHVADVAPQLVLVAVAHAAAADEDVAGRDVDHPVDHPHRGGLAAAGRPDEHADLARGHLEAEAVDGRAVGARVALGDLPELQRGGLTGGRRPLGMGGVRCGQRGGPGEEGPRK